MSVERCARDVLTRKTRDGGIGGEGQDKVEDVSDVACSHPSDRAGSDDARSRGWSDAIPRGKTSIFLFHFAPRLGEQWAIPILRFTRTLSC